jgi:hypothetical protein
MLSDLVSHDFVFIPVSVISARGSSLRQQPAVIILIHIRFADIFVKIFVKDVISTALALTHIVLLYSMIHLPEAGSAKIV